MRPINIPKNIIKYFKSDLSKAQICKQASTAYQQIHRNEPIVISVVMPAYNESENIVPALCSLCENKTNHNVEIIVVNNNSSDDTEQLIYACGVTCVNEKIQGITVARNAGLKQARGIIVLNADADTIYPSNWIEEMSKPLLTDSGVAITYGTFGFVPIGTTGRSIYYIYEYLAEISRFYNSLIKDQAVNVYGFNSGFRREQGLKVDSFNHPAGTNEDGWMAVKLRNAGFGKLYRVSSKAMVWTTDRRVQIDGGLMMGLKKRVKRIFNFS